MYRHSEAERRAALIAADPIAAASAAKGMDGEVLEREVMTPEQIIEAMLDRYAEKAKGRMVTFAIHNQASAFTQALQRINFSINRWGLGIHPGGPEVELELTLGTKPIIGYRAWGIAEHELRDGSYVPRLAALSPGVSGGMTHWPARHRMEARCARIHHEAPWPSCHCGMWAFKAEPSAKGKASGFLADASCYGAVALWGRVLECSNGYRGQYAYPQSLVVAQDVDDDTAEALEREYGIPVQREDSKRATNPESDA